MPNFYSAFTTIILNTMLKNDLFLKALRGETVTRPPVWMMRQAGRYLPDFMVLKEKYDFFTRCQTPELATEITLMPIDQIGPDAAILFSDILVVLQAMQIPVEMKESVGPWLPKPIRSQAEVDQVILPDIHEHLGYVLDAVKMTKQELANRVPLIGFAGSPWTLLCYAVQGQGSKTFDKAKAFCFSQPESAHELLQKITTTTIAYLKEKVKSGVDAVQIFDSWGGLLSPEDYQIFSWPYIQQIIDALKEEIPVIVFGKDAGLHFMKWENLVHQHWVWTGLALQEMLDISLVDRLHSKEILIPQDYFPPSLKLQKRFIK